MYEYKSSGRIGDRLFIPSNRWSEVVVATHTRMEEKVDEVSTKSNGVPQSALKSSPSHCLNTKDSTVDEVVSVSDSITTKLVTSYSTAIEDGRTQSEVARSSALQDVPEGQGLALQDVDLNQSQPLNSEGGRTCSDGDDNVQDHSPNLDERLAGEETGVVDSRTAEGSENPSWHDDDIATTPAASISIPSEDSTPVKDQSSPDHNNGELTMSESTHNQSNERHEVSEGSDVTEIETMDGEISHTERADEKGKVSHPETSDKKTEAAHIERVDEKTEASHTESSENETAITSPVVETPDDESVNSPPTAAPELPVRDSISSTSSPEGSSASKEIPVVTQAVRDMDQERTESQTSFVNEYALNNSSESPTYEVDRNLEQFSEILLDSDPSDSEAQAVAVSEEASAKKKATKRVRFADEVAKLEGGV